MLKLDCVLNTTPCTSTAPITYGTITLEEVAANGIKVTVDLAGTGHKFRDLMLNYETPTAVTDNDPDNVVKMTADGYSINPYSGLFDVGDPGKKNGGTMQGWNGGDPYSTILTGVATPLILDKFKVKDSTTGVYAALHIQDIGSSTGGDCDGSGTKPACVPGKTGPGSLKIGATLVQPPTPVPDGGPTWTLLASSLVALAAARRQRTR